MTTTNNMTEGEYLELANQLKESFDVKDKEVDLLLRENEELKKNFISIYGMLRVIDYYSQGNIDDQVVITLIETARGYASSVLDDC